MDRALTAKDGQIVVVLVNGEFTVKRLKRTRTGLLLVAENPAYPAIAFTPDTSIEIWSVVTFVLHPV